MSAAAMFGGLVLIVSGCGGSSGGSSANSSGCPPSASTQSFGNSAISAKAIGKGYDRTFVIRVKDRRSGVAVHGAQVSIQGTMTCPHLMPLYQKSLHEVSPGTYKGDYNLIMQGQWTINIVARTKKAGASTSALPVTVKIAG